jgi:ATP-binding cassette subfamily C protein LapB
VGLTSVVGDIQFEKVTFRYDTAADPALEVVDLSIKVGTITGVKGKGGSGRTTLLKLIQGDIEPTSGRVTIGGVSTMEPNFQAIRPCIAYVGAAPVMFSGTIMENLTVFSPAKRDFARKMSQLLGLETTINLLPDGYETELGRGIGDDLPMSIAQQVNIVRALTNRPRVLALDEANMVLDAVAEPALIRALETLRGRLTVIVVTHRPSLLALCDRLILVEDGHATWSVPAPSTFERAAS